MSVRILDLQHLERVADQKGGMVGRLGAPARLVEAVAATRIQGGA